MVRFTVTAAGVAWANKPAQIGILVPGGGAATWTDTTTDSNGVITFTQPATGRFQVRMTVVATDTSLAVTSGVTTFTVRAAATVASPAKGTLKVVLAGAAGQRAQVQRYDRSRWTVATTFVADRADITLTGLVSGARYRIVVPSTTAVTGMTSATITIS
jgi:hypothetical protein